MYSAAVSRSIGVHDEIGACRTGGSGVHPAMTGCTRCALSPPVESPACFSAAPSRTNAALMIAPHGDGVDRTPRFGEVSSLVVSTGLFHRRLATPSQATLGLGGQLPHRGLHAQAPRGTLEALINPLRGSGTSWAPGPRFFVQNAHSCKTAQKTKGKFCKKALFCACREARLVRYLKRERDEPPPRCKGLCQSRDGDAGTPRTTRVLG